MADKVSNPGRIKTVAGEKKMRRIMGRCLTLFAGCLAVALLGSTPALAQLPIPEEKKTYKPCYHVKMVKGRTYSVPGKCTDKNTKKGTIYFWLRGGIAQARLKITGIGDFSTMDKKKQLFVKAGDKIVLKAVTDLGGRGGVYLTVMDMSKGTPVEPLFKEDEISPP